MEFNKKKLLEEIANVKDDEPLTQELKDKLRIADIITSTQHVINSSKSLIDDVHEAVEKIEAPVVTLISSFTTKTVGEFKHKLALLDGFAKIHAYIEMAYQQYNKKEEE